MTMAELKLRTAHTAWLEAKAVWQKSLADVNIAKTEWEQAQAEFYGDRSVMTSAASCGGCTSCTTGGCH